MKYTDVEGLCKVIIEDDTICKTDGLDINSQLYTIYDNLCKTAGNTMGLFMNQIMKKDYGVDIFLG